MHAEQKRQSPVRRSSDNDRDDRDDRVFYLRNFWSGNIGRGRDEKILGEDHPIITIIPITTMDCRTCVRRMSANGRTHRKQTKNVAGNEYSPPNRIAGKSKHPRGCVLAADLHVARRLTPLQPQDPVERCGESENNFVAHLRDDVGTDQVDEVMDDRPDRPG